MYEFKYANLYERALSVIYFKVDELNSMLFMHKILQ